jgi:hypothetical protein
MIASSVTGKVGEEIKPAHYPGAQRTAPTTLPSSTTALKASQMMQSKLAVHLTLVQRNPQTTT